MAFGAPGIDGISFDKIEALGPKAVAERVNSFE
jgi:hypothetical protein